MKLLHTSDWHLGHILYDFDRFEEQAAMLDDIIGIARRETPDVFLLCGDVFDCARPSNRIYRLFVDKIEKLHTACPDMPIIITAGNHDSASHHELFRTPWLKQNIHLLGTLPDDDSSDAEKFIITIPQKGIIVATPYVNQRFTGNDFFKSLIEHANRLNTGGLPVVLMAHTAVSGCDAAGHTDATPDMIGNIECRSLADLGEGYDYAALGHIHRAQWLTGHRARYCGTPLPVSFDERAPHGISMVEINAHGSEPQLRHIDIAPQRPLVNIPSLGFTTIGRALELLADFPADIPAYIRLNISQPEPPGADAPLKARSALADKAADFCVLNYKSSATDDDNNRFNSSMTVDEFIEATPADIARRFAAGRGYNFDDDFAPLFAEVTANIDEENRQ